MTACRVANDNCSSSVEAGVPRGCSKNFLCCEADVLKGSGPATAWVADSPIFYVARDYSLGGERGTERPDMGKIIDGLPETAMDNKQEWERPFPAGKPKLNELIRIIAIADARIERRRCPFEDVAQC